ncbi:hypothetical protein [Flavobacterium rhizosphaerae]|uniref:Uncharacterized protein n=1 Tax=Flavobacterium rhizosphaerae TaxID=3163298 RepID=A0ABW8YXL9_9FLAO
MDSLKKIGDNPKNIVAFWLMLFFFASSLANTFSPVSQSYKYKAAFTKVEKKIVSFAINDDDTIDFSDQLTDTDADDIKFIFEGYSLPQFNALASHKHFFTSVSLPTIISSIPLYKLFCIWKFHLIN